MQSDDNIMKQLIIDEMADLNERSVIKYARQAIAEGFDEKDISYCLKKGMEIVGQRFEQKEYYVTELVMAGIIFREVCSINSFRQSNASKQKSIGTLIIATVEGDIHDIGKEIVANLASASGFEVVDLGVDVPAKTIIDKVSEIKPDILGLSGVMSFAQSQMQLVIQMLEAKNLRNTLHIAAGGATFSNNSINLDIGADFYSTDAWETIEQFKKWVANEQ